VVIPARISVRTFVLRSESLNHLSKNEVPVAAAVCGWPDCFWTIA
jgi:hypothetical protein